jgi:long-chain fatty acid transport protein
MRRPIRTIASAAVLAMMANSAANAGSFSLYTESSAAAIGNYGAGIAAEAADASTGWYNPAGLALLHRQEVVSGEVTVFASAKLSGASTFSTLGLPNYTQTFTNLSGGKMGYVPSFHYALPFGQNMAFGLSLVAPYGLATQWDRVGPVRYAATTSNLITANLSPEIGGRLTDHFALGLGIDIQYARVRFHSVLGSPTSLLRFNLPYFLDSLSYNKGHSYGVGFHAGGMLLFQQDHTRIGLNYQSQMRHRFNGFSRLQGRLASLGPTLSPSAVLAADGEAIFWSDTLTSNNVIFPDVTTLSIYKDINSRLAILGSAVYTGWNSLKTLELQRVAAYAPQLAQTLVNSTTTENYRNVWRFALGANYQLTDLLMLRVGGGWDQTPTRNQFRDVRIPDTNRWAASVGAHYQLQPNIGFDLGYTHLFAGSNYKVNRTNAVGATSTYNVDASIKAHADLVGVQAVWVLDQPAPMIAPTK